MKTKTKSILRLVTACCALAALVVCMHTCTTSIDKAVARYKQEKLETQKTAFRAFVKQTGNPKKLTFEEWIALKEMK